MFLPWYVTIEPEDSAAQHLLASVAASMAYIAPERIVELVTRSGDLSITITDSNLFRCEALPSFKAIAISHRVVELAWAFAYGYWQIYQTLFEGRESRGGLIDLTSFAELEPTLRLLRWAHGSLVGQHSLPWPPETARPSISRVQGSVEHACDELALCSIGMYLHHELAHVYATRDPSLSPIEEERVCDSSAASWILGDPNLGAEVVQKRSLGVAIGMLMLTARGLASRNATDGVHPPGYERLVAVLDERVPEAQEVVWGMVVGMLALHVSDAGMPANREAYDSFRSAALGYCKHIRIYSAN